MPAQPAALRSAHRIVSYDGKAPFPGGGEPPLTAVGRLRAGVTGALVIVPFTGLAAAVWLQHVTWSVNSLCHLIGARPCTTRRSPLAEDRPRAALPPSGR